MLSIFSVRDDYGMNGPAGIGVLLLPPREKNNEIHLFGLSGAGQVRKHV